MVLERWASRSCLAAADWSTPDIIVDVAEGGVLVLAGVVFTPPDCGGVKPYRLFKTFPKVVMVGWCKPKVCIFFVIAAVSASVIFVLVARSKPPLIKSAS